MKGKASGDGERVVRPTHVHAPRRSTARLVVSCSIHVRGTDCTESKDLIAAHPHTGNDGEATLRAMTSHGRARFERLRRPVQGSGGMVSRDQENISS